MPPNRGCELHAIVRQLRGSGTGVGDSGFEGSGLFGLRWLDTWAQPPLQSLNLARAYGSFRKLGVPYSGVLILRILLFWGTILGSPISETPISPKPWWHNVEGPTSHTRVVWKPGNSRRACSYPSRGLVGIPSSEGGVQSLEFTFWGLRCGTS